MTAVLFWNLNKKPLIDELACLCTEHEVDVLVLAECDIPEPKLQLALNAGRASPYLSPPNYSQRLKFLTRFPLDCFKLVSDEDEISIRQVVPPVGPEVLLVGVHLGSKLYMTEMDQSFASTRVMRSISEAEARIGHDRTILIGDLNMNPFEDGVVSAEGLHAVMARDVAARKTRIVKGQERKLFYNPMWGRMGDCSKGPPGTYFKDMSNYVNYYWHTFDQVLLRPDLLGYFDDESLVVITETGGKSLLNKGKPSNKFSDHLPIYVRLKTEEAV